MVRYVWIVLDASKHVGSFAVFGRSRFELMGYGRTFMGYLRRKNSFSEINRVWKGRESSA